MRSSRRIVAGTTAAALAASAAVASGFSRAPVARATGRLHAEGATGPATVRVYAEPGGAFALLDSAPRVRTDTVVVSAPAVIAVDLTGGAVHVASGGAVRLRVDGAMSGASPALWLTTTSPHAVFDRGGSGVHGGTVPR